MSNDSPYWFPAKRYGWGWGLPIAWQGWVVLIAFVAASIAGGYFLPPHRNPSLFALFIICIVALLICIMWLKGEPPSWRWGK